jgi:signal transduction histidine kinase
MTDQGGHRGPWSDRDRWRAHRAEMRRRRAEGGWGPPGRSGPRRGFGCLFGLVFLVVAASILLATASLLSALGPIPVVIAAVVVVGFLAVLARSLGLAARDLDAMLAATRDVERGDYSVRVGATRSGFGPVRELARGLDTMTTRLEADEEQRRSLLADVSHELRTPLTVITGQLEGILDGVYPADEAHLSPILDETRVLARLIDDLRTIALSEAGTLALHPEPTDPDVLVGEVVRSFTAAAAGVGVTLATAIDGDLPIIEVDPVRVREVLANLVSNALRHTPTGGAVTVGGSSTTEAVILTVADTGPGIPPELLPHVFDRFVKGTSSRGSGLGLAIARGLVEAHGGTIDVVSPTPGSGGTTFRVTLPRTAASKDPT